MKFTEPRRPMKIPSSPASCPPVENDQKKPKLRARLVDEKESFGAVRVTGRWTSCSSVQAREHGPGAPVPP